MTHNAPKRIARNLLLKQKCYSLDNYAHLKRIFEENQVTVIAYKKYANSILVTELIERLHIETEIANNDSFLYLCNNLKFLFVNDDIPDDDKCALLRHELGHLFDPDFKNTGVNTSNIKKEEFANEFSHFLKTPGIRFKTYVFMKRKWKLLTGIAAILLCLAIAFSLVRIFYPPADTVTVEIQSFDKSDPVYYVTSSGEKFHRKNCITIRYRNNVTTLHLDDAKMNGYTPCRVCCPDEENYE